MSIISCNPEVEVREYPMPETSEKKDVNKEFRQWVLDSKWEEVVAAYERDVKFHSIKANISKGDTALHVAVKVGADYETVIKRLVGAIEKHEMKNQVEESKETLAIEKHETKNRAEESKGALKGALIEKNMFGNTPLHIAANRGFLDMCKCFIGENGKRKALIEKENMNGETPVFMSVLTRQTHVFLYLNDVSPEGVGDPVRNKNGDSILHYAIRREFFDLAILIIHLYPTLIVMPNNGGVTPLYELATRPSAFESGNNFSWWKQILYCCISVKPLDVEKVTNSYLGKRMKPRPLGQKEKEKDKSQISIQVSEPQTSPASEKVDKKKSYTCVPPICSTFFQFVYTSLGLSQLDIIKSTKQKNIWGSQLLEEFMKEPYESYLGSGGRPHVDEDEYSSPLKQIEEIMTGKLATSTKENPQKPAVETPILVAAQNGIPEIVDMFNNKIQSAVHDVTRENENVLLVAVKNRQPHVVELLRKKLPKHHFDSLILGEDKKGNTVLHLAADITGTKQKTWKIAGVAMQMMWDIKWYEYIMELGPDHLNFRNNNDDKTPGEIFKDKHDELVKDGSDWLKDTSESCSVVAALIAGVSFATSSSVPGGTEDTGQPALEGQPAFDAFAISSLVGLSFSVTALIMFLAILTSRKQAEDFRRSLPLKLLLGLSSLFISIASMLVSFCAGHFFVLEDKYKHILFPLYVATCLPVTFYAVVQFPLYIDLVKVIFKKVPQSSVKGLLL